MRWRLNQTSEKKMGNSDTFVTGTVFRTTVNKNYAYASTTVIFKYLYHVDEVITPDAQTLKVRYFDNMHFCDMYIFQVEIIRLCLSTTLLQ